MKAQQICGDYMVRYQHALDGYGKTVSARSIAGTETSGVRYTCLGCANDLVARVNGQQHQPHFAHKIQVECSGETYLHRLAKQVFFETYQNCLVHETPFEIVLPVDRRCAKYAPLINKHCSLGTADKAFDLTNYYREVRVEARDGSFVPDVTLVSQKNPNDKIYVEIAVTHFLSEEKAASSNRIIEIPVENESHVEHIRTAKLTTKVASFQGFAVSTDRVHDDDCKCDGENYYVFTAYLSGKAILRLMTLRSLFSEVRKDSEKIVYTNISKASDRWQEDLDWDGRRSKGRPDQSSWDAEDRGGRFVQEVKLAAARGTSVRNCFLCKYHGTSYDLSPGGGIFCKTFKKRCNSNEAASCERFRRAE